MTSLEAELFTLSRVRGTLGSVDDFDPDKAAFAIEVDDNIVGDFLTILLRSFG